MAQHHLKEEWKEIIENTISKSNKEEHLRNEDQEGRIDGKSIRVKEIDSFLNYWETIILLAFISVSYNEVSIINKYFTVWFVRW